MDNTMLSVVIPITERFDDLREVFETYEQAITRIARDYEFLFVLDGRYHEARSQLEALAEDGRPVRILQMAKNFGESTALTVGFEHARGDVLLTLPAYFQVEPSELPRLIDALNDHDMVVVRRWPRSDSRFNRLQTEAFSRLLRSVTGAPFRDLGCSVRILRRAVAHEVPLYGDQYRFFPVLAARQGFRVKEIDFAQSPRERYRRVYRPGVYFRRVLDLLTVFFLTRFTKKPLRFFGLIGTGVASIGAVIVLYLVVMRLFTDMALADRPALLLASLMVVLGVQIFGLGLIGELIIFTHAKDMKEYNVREIVNDGRKAGSEETPSESSEPREGEAAGDADAAGQPSARSASPG
jgi:glycosyltransferase involved in cell wall biosynthesis